MQFELKSDAEDFSVWNNYLNSIIQLYQHLFINGKVKTSIKLFKKSKSIIDQENCPKIVRAKFFAYYGKLLVYTIFFLSNPIEKAWKQLDRAEEHLKNSDQEILSMIMDQKGLAHYYNNLKKTEPNFQEARELITRALEIRNTLNNPQLISDSQFHLGLINEREGDIETAEKNYQQSYDLAKNNGFKMEQSYPIRHIGFLHRQKSEHEKALKCFIESKNLREEVGFKIGLSFSYISLGETYQALERYEEAIENFKRGYNLSKEVVNNRGVMLSTLFSGILYKKLKMNDLALKSLEEAKIHATNLNHEIALEMINKELTEFVNN
jgi:tetratricopeptide (TPR) repeat protein